MVIHGYMSCMNQEVLKHHNSLLDARVNQSPTLGLIEEVVYPLWKEKTILSPWSRPCQHSLSISFLYPLNLRVLFSVQSLYRLFSVDKHYES